MKRYKHVLTLCLTLILTYWGVAFSAPIKKDIVLMIDNTGSMKRNDPHFLTKKAVVRFVENLSGDIKIFINVTNDTDFVRDGLNLIYKKKITLKEALVGFKFDIKHVSGKTYCINNNNGKIITPQYTKIITNMGMRRERQHPAPPMVGNLIIVFDVVFPNELTEEQMKTISECL